MTFTSVTFVFYFLPAFLFVYVLLSKTWWRNLLLVAASLLFYAWGDLGFLPVLVLSAVLNYLAARMLTDRQGRSRRVLLWAGIGLNLAPLIVFKYTGARLGLPLGISFFTFKAISYLVDVYRKDVIAERDPVAFAAYLTLFPQILAGPIQRLADTHGEMQERRVTLAKFRLGVEYCIIGMAEKLLIANPLAAPADLAFSTPPAMLSTAAAWLGLWAYTLQLYFDFAGYTHIAIGVGHMLGFTFPRNFNFPYASKSITDFWQRWHITLSSWLRDYVWYPLGANRKGRLRTYCNVLIVFGLCGIWHGANYTFLLWGLFHGVLLVMERAGLLSLLKRVGRVAATAYALFMVMIGWVLFRAESLPQALQYLSALAGSNPAFASDEFLGALTPDVVIALAAGTVFAFPLPRMAWEAMQAASSARRKLALEAASAAVLTMVLVVALMALAEGSHNPFLYFRY